VHASLRQSDEGVLCAAPTGNMTFGHPAIKRDLLPDYPQETILKSRVGFKLARKLCRDG